MQIEHARASVELRATSLRLAKSFKRLIQHISFVIMQIPYYVDLLGTFVFAISGALAAFGKKMYQDIFGVSFTAFITAIGGGTLRDIILGFTSLAWIADESYIIAIFVGVLLVVFFRRYIKEDTQNFISLRYARRRVVHNSRCSKSTWLMM